MDCPCRHQANLIPYPSSLASANLATSPAMNVPLLVLLLVLPLLLLLCPVSCRGRCNCILSKKHCTSLLSSSPQLTAKRELDVEFDGASSRDMHAVEVRPPLGLRGTLVMASRYVGKLFQGWQLGGTPKSPAGSSARHKATLKPSSIGCCWALPQPSRAHRQFRSWYLLCVEGCHLSPTSEKAGHYCSCLPILLGMSIQVNSNAAMYLCNLLC